MERNHLSIRKSVPDRLSSLLTGVCEQRYRRLPPAVTPLRPSDLVAGVAGHIAETGRDEFCQEIVSYLDATHGGTYTSFRRALCGCLLTLAERTLDKRSDVLIPAFCSSDFPDAIGGAGLDAVRYDVDPETLAFDMESIEDRTTEDTLAVIAVNVLGYSSPMDRIETYCEERGLYLVEALGYALGAEYNGRRLGTFGDCSVLNFQQGKPIPIGGGLVVSQSPSIEFTDDGRPEVAPNFGMVAGYTVFGHPPMYAIYSHITGLIERYSDSATAFSTHPESKFGVQYSPPFGTISNFQGAIGKRAFARIEAHRRQREDTAHVYRTDLADCPHLKHIQPIAGLSKHQYVRYPLLIDTPALRDELQTALADIGVETSALYDWPPIDGESFPGAARLQREILTLPTHPYVTTTDRQRIVRTVTNVLTSPHQ